VTRARIRYRNGYMTLQRSIAHVRLAEWRQVHL